MTEVVKVLGPAGTGKTTYILRQIEHLLSQGVSLDKIGFLSFSRQAIQAMGNKLQMNPLPPYFRTFHSFGAALLNVNRSQLFTEEDALSIAQSVATQTAYDKLPDLALLVDNIEGYAHNAGISFDQAYRLVSSRHSFNLADIHRLRSAKAAYKKEKGKLEYRDMLDLSQLELPELDYIFFDEAQDLSHSQVSIAQAMAKMAKKVWYVGDPNQAVYGWAGNSEQWLIDMKADQTEVLPVSYRLPASILRFSQQIVDRIGSRINFQPRDEEGFVKRIDSPQNVNLLNGQRWLILARNHSYLLNTKRYFQAHGIPYYEIGAKQQLSQYTAIHSKLQALFLYDEMLKNGQLPPEHERLIVKVLGGRALDKARQKEPVEVGSGLSLSELEGLFRLKDMETLPTIGIGTFHASKGLECDNAVVLTDCTAQQHRSWANNERAEVCPFYVACTRARQGLYLVASRKGYLNGF